jgi:mercuric ion binding protein
MKGRLIFTAGVLALATVGFVTSGGFPTATGPTASAQAAATQVAAEATAIFTVENMTCGLCPITVKKAMEGVEGVRLVEVDFAAKKAIVVFDPSLTTVEAIATASTNAGYPAAAVGG